MYRASYGIPLSLDGFYSFSCLQTYILLDIFCIIRINNNSFLIICPLYSKGCTSAKVEVKQEYARSTTPLVFPSQKPCLPSMLMELVMPKTNASSSSSLSRCVGVHLPVLHSISVNHPSAHAICCTNAA